MENTKEYSSKYDRAKKRVADIKGFYNHLVAYIIINVILLILSDTISFMFISPRIMENVDFLNWINWNVYGTAIFWGIGLLIHGLRVFSPIRFLGKGWEDRQIQKYMKENSD